MIVLIVIAFALAVTWGFGWKLGLLTLLAMILTRGKYKRPGNRRAGWVYFITDDAEQVKIGRTRLEPAQRLSRLQGQSPRPLTLLHEYWCPDAVAEEARLHDLFSQCHEWREWYDRACVERIIRDERRNSNVTPIRKKEA